MCYDIKASLEAQLNRARRKNNEKAIREIIEKLAPLTDLPIYHASGFSHPKLFIYTNQHPFIPTPSTWGLIPSWVRDRVQQLKLWNNTLNARGETIFEKPSFRAAARTNRCLVYVDGFYEHHHCKGKTYPFYISGKNHEPLALAGLWNEWVDEDSSELFHTFSIVTTQGNELMKNIHNNPKLEGPRMPVILQPEQEEHWLLPLDSEDEINTIHELIQPYPEEWLQAYTVSRLRGKEYMGNVPAASHPHSYEELIY